jgi:hypothetical protein
MMFGKHRTRNVLNDPLANREMEVPRYGSHTGLGHLDVMDNMRRLGQAHALVRSDGWHLGWFVIERLTRAHANLGADGIGQQIDFEVSFQRVPVPYDPNAYFPAFWGQVSP